MPEEAATFLHQTMRLNLTASDIAVFEQQTEGWITGLQLAAVSMQSGQGSNFVEAFAGTHRYTLDYLTDEVLERRPPDTKNFLLKTAVLERLCGQLCDSRTGDTNGQTMLERFEQTKDRRPLLRIGYPINQAIYTYLGMYSWM